VTFIISSEETIPIANPRSVNRVGDAVLHYKPAGGTIPSPINSRPSWRGHGLYFPTASTISTTALPTAPHFSMTGKRVHPSSRDVYNPDVEPVPEHIENLPVLKNLASLTRLKIFIMKQKGVFRASGSIKPRLRAQPLSYFARVSLFVSRENYYFCKV
jgi:hypothetical protein